MRQPLQPFTQPFTVDQGICYALFAYDIGLAINLDEADRRITATKERSSLKPTRRTPHYLDYRPAPLRITQDASPVPVGEYKTSARAEVMLYDFGALSVTYLIPVQGTSASLLGLTEDLYEHTELLADSRRRVEQLLDAIRDTVERPSISPYVEDYVILHAKAFTSSAETPPWTAFDQELARILRCERAALSEQEVRDATACRVSVGLDDAAIIDWNAALLFGPDMEDVRAVLEFANVELLEMRILDHQLDDALDQAYEALSKRIGWRFRLPGTFEADLARIARLQVDSALLFERVTNTLKLMGDQYLSRVYRLASQRFHLEAWDASIIRKLQTLDSIYGKMADRASARRMEALEWVIIILIAVSIVLSLVP